MAPVEVDFRSLAPGARVSAQAEALAALAAGKVIVAPGDTGYLVLAAAAMPAGTELARASTGSGGTAWLGRDPEAVAGTIPGLSRIARKLLRVLTPGPAVLLLHLDEAGLSEARSRLSMGPGIIDDGQALRVRMPGPSLAGTLASRADAALCAWEPTDGAGRAFDEAQRAADAAVRVGINAAQVLSDGRPTGGGSRHRPTVVAVERSGRVRVESEGTYESRFVMKQAALNVLLVCTGNTCRSPMAEAIAAGLAAKPGKAEADGPPMHFTSAGVGAVAGAPRTPEGGQAVRRLGYKPAGGGSRPLTRSLIGEADLIYAMTRSHLSAILAMDAGAAGKAFLLDPAGADVPDPIGLSQGAYDDTARRLEGMLRERLKEWRSAP